VETHGHADPDKWLLENPGFVSGGNLRWFRDQLSQSEKAVELFSGIDAYDILMKEAERVEAGSAGVIFLPMMMGAMTPEWNPRAKAGFFGLTLYHTREHLVRAILEASAFGLRDIVDSMETSGLKIDEIRICGGGSKSPLWRQIKADVTGKKVSIVSDGNDTCFGAAILAAVAIGYFNSIDEAVEATIKVVDTLEPEKDRFEIYCDAYEKYREIFERLKPLFENL
jgi:xylulokinase